MTPRERLLTTLRGEIPDCVPVAPDFSNMIPARLTGKPFWDLYLYNDPPIHEAYIDCAKRFNIDSLMDGYFWVDLPELRDPDTPPWERFIVQRTPERIVTQSSYVEEGKRRWAPTVEVYYRADSPTHGVAPEKVSLPPQPQRWEPLEGVKPVDRSAEGLRRVMERMGDQGLVGLSVGSACALNNEEAIYRYYDHPELHEEWAAQRVEQAERRFHALMRLPVRPDFLTIPSSGSLVFQTPQILRQLAFPAVQRVIDLATAAGLPTHLHSCGPEAELVELLAQETALTVIDPLEIPPMGNCNLRELKQRFGGKLTLKGNLHTTDVMLRGTPADVIRASRQAVDDAAEGGRFILSTGDQCGRDTPDENLQVMVETARTYGRY